MRSTAAFFLAAALAAPTAAQTVYRCTSASGAVTMQQVPCDKASTGSATVYSARPAPAPREDATRRQQGAAEPRRHWIVWTGDPRRDAALAAANLDGIRMLGQGCEDRLRMRSNELQDCQRFLQQLAPGGDFGRIGDKLAEITRDGASLQQADRFDLARAQRASQDIGRLKDFILVALRQ